jgi:recombination protein RecT
VILAKKISRGRNKLNKNQLATSSIQSLVFGELTEQDIVTIRETIGKDCNESQFKLFMAISKNAGANPILNEIYPAVRGGQLTVQFGIDFYVRKAKEADGYQGYDVQLVHENDAFKMHQEKDDDGRYFIVIDEHSFGFPRGKVIGGYAFAYKEGLKPFSVIMEVDEVEHYKRSNIGMQKTMWTNNFNDMFKKHMVRRALKAAFSLNFDDDQGQQNQPESYDPSRQRVDITPTTAAIETDQGEINEEDELQKQWDAINEKIKGYGWTKDSLKNFIKEKKNKKAKDLSLPEVVGLSKLIDLQHSKEQQESKEAPAEQQDSTDIEDFDQYFNEE